MKKGAFSVSAGFILLFSFIYFFDDQGFLAALIPAVLVHEAGHCIVLHIFMARLKEVRLDLTGIRLSYVGAHMSLLQEIAVAFSGPLFGLAYAFILSALPFEDPILHLSAGISILLSAFNLLPAMPLDGGRALYLFLLRLSGRRRAAKVQYIIGLSVSLILMIAGIWCVGKGFGFALILSGIWLLISASEDACKIRGFVIQ